MKLRALHDLQDRLDEDFAWRLMDIHELKTSVREVPGPRQKTMIRAGVPLLYAHWEGFVKAGAEALVNYVAHQRLRFRELAPCFVVRALRGEVASISEDTRFRRQVQAISTVLEGLDKRAPL